MRISSLALLVASAVLLHHNARADWIQNGIPITQTNGQAAGPRCAPDGAGGAIMCWTESRLTTYDIYAQRVDGFGNVLWTTNGVLVCGATGDQTSPTLIPDGAGGVIITWIDQRGADADIYVQRLNSAGGALWPVNGVGVCTAMNIQALPSLLSDGSGGAIVTWQDGRSGTHYDIYARRITGGGTPQWTVNGNPICTLTGNQTRAAIVSDGASGAIICWTDARLATWDIFAQRVNSSGTVQWAVNGLVICGAPNDQSDNASVSDGAGGAVIVWRDERTSVDGDIYAQRINGVGAPQWFLDGVPVTTATGSQSNLALESDGAGGAIVVWQDSRVGPLEVDLYGQRINSLGAPIWQNGGLPICVGPGVPSLLDIATDGQGGGIVTWTDDRLPSDEDIFAQRVSTDGVPRWFANGVYVGAALDTQMDASCAADGTGGIIAAWRDGRSADNIYAQRIEPRYGYWGRPEPTIVSAIDNPSDQGGYVNVRWDASQIDVFFYPGVSHYSLWRSTDFVATQAAAASIQIVESPNEIGKDFGGAAIWRETTASGPVYWEWIANQPAVYQDTYSLLAPTRQDGALAPHYFKVLAHESPTPPSRVWESGVVSGYSIDNLAPAAPIELAGTQTPWDVTLTWTSGGAIPDFSHYTIYRGSGFVLPLPQYRIGTSTQTHHVDDSVPGGYLHYLVTAFDTHGNESLPSNEWSPSGTTPVGDTPSIRALTVLDNVPNPFSASTRLRIGLPRAGEVSIEIFDVAGRRVRSERSTTVAAGWRDVSFDARDASGRALPSGVYFYRVSAAGETITRKMVIAR